ncbi:putative membrane protein YccC [Bradyrhizobium sp. USDA 4341]
MGPVPISLSAMTAQPETSQSPRRIPSLLPSLLFGLRLWAAACLALYIAFWLQLDNAYWAGTTAAIVAQPSLGASLRKGRFRMVGTVLGAVAIVILTACFPQSRAGFLLGLAFWGAACGFVATILRGFAAYGAALAGFTAVIIASDELGATGGPSGDIFLLALTRVSEIWIGLACATLVMASTDVGRARRRLAELFAVLRSELTHGLARALAGAGGDEMRMSRRDLIRRTMALEPVIDEVIGEAPDLRLSSQELRAAVQGLFVALSSWRMVSNHLELAPRERRRDEAEAVLLSLPTALRSTSVEGDLASWATNAAHLRRICAAAVKAMMALPVDTPSARMLADAAAEALMGITRTLDGIAMIVGRGRCERKARAAQLQIPDYQPALINAVRIFATICCVEFFWITTAWPSGAVAIAWSTIFITSFSPNVGQAYATAKSRWLGVTMAAVCAAVIKFAVLPGCETFPSVAMAIGVVLIPAAALSTLPWQPAMFGAIASWFLPLVNPENVISYDSVQFYNSVLAIIVGAGVSTLAFRLVPPASPAFHAARLLALTLRDLREITTARTIGTRSAWESAVYARLSVFPQQAASLQRSRLLVALSVGSEVIRLRRIARRLGESAQIDAALEPLAWGRSAVARERFEHLDNALSTRPAAGRKRTLVLRAQGCIRVISEELLRHAVYFDAKAIHELC